MARKRKGPKPEDDVAPKLAPVPDKLARPFADALAGMKIEKPAAKKPAPPPRSTPPPPVASKGAKVKMEDAVALRRAFEGVRPLGDRGARLPPSHPSDAPKPRTPPELAFRDTTDDDAARARLASLVGRGMRFDVRRAEDGRVEAIRVGGDPAPVVRLAKGQLTPETTLDLHGMTSAQADTAIARFVRDAHRRGARVLVIVHGKGLHSEGGVGTLGDRTVRALSEGGAAPLVLAFATAPARHGGTGAILVQLVDRL